MQNQMLTAIPGLGWEDNSVGRGETKLTASGSAAAPAALSGALAGEKHSRETTEALGWLCATNTAQARNHSGRRKQTQARPLPPGSQLGGAVHLKASDQLHSLQFAKQRGGALAGATHFGF